MPAGTTTLRRRIRWLTTMLVLPLLIATGCQRTPHPPAHATADVPAAPANRPVEAVLVLRDRLLARDAAGFAQLAVPPAVYAQLDAAWTQGRSRWPLDELPMDSRLLRMLAALQAPNADAQLMLTFNQQFAHADADIDQAVRTLVVFGTEFVQQHPAYTQDERDHTAQAITAIGRWARAAPLSDPKRAQHFFLALTAAATRTGIDATRGPSALASMGMQQSLSRLSPFLATLIDQLHQRYGLDFDATLRSVQVSLLQQTGDTARLRLQYRLAGQHIDAIVPAIRIDGHWYLANYVHRAEQSLVAPAPKAATARPAM